MEFNEFNRRLDALGLDPRHKYLLMTLFEMMKECLKQGDQNAQVLLAFSESLQGIVNLQARDREMLKQVLSRGEVEGVTVESVTVDPEERKN